MAAAGSRGLWRPGEERAGGSRGEGLREEEIGSDRGEGPQEKEIGSDRGEGPREEVAAGGHGEEVALGTRMGRRPNG